METRSRVILVDENDREVGTSEKLSVHRQGKLHRAFSIFVIDSLHRVLVQKRASTKYHSAGLWSNTCCGHPLPEESTDQAVHRRLKQEVGFDRGLDWISSFTYNVDLGHGIREHEYDHIYLGNFDGTPKPSLREVDDWRWVPLENLNAELQESPREYTYWLSACIGTVIKIVAQNSRPS